MNAIESEINEFLDNQPFIKETLTVVETKLGVKVIVQAYVLLLVILYYLVFGVNCHQFATILIIIYPIKRCCALMATPDVDEVQMWIIYWIIFGVSSAVEGCGVILHEALPVYWLAKVALHVHLYHPKTNSLKKIHSSIVKPMGLLMKGDALTAEDVEQMSPLLQTILNATPGHGLTPEQVSQAFRDADYWNILNGLLSQFQAQIGNTLNFGRGTNEQNEHKAEKKHSKHHHHHHHHKGHHRGHSKHSVHSKSGSQQSMTTGSAYSANAERDENVLETGPTGTTEEPGLD